MASQELKRHPLAGAAAERRCGAGGRGNSQSSGATGPDAGESPREGTATRLHRDGRRAPREPGHARAMRTAPMDPRPRARIRVGSGSMDPARDPSFRQRRRAGLGLAQAPAAAESDARGTKDLARGNSLRSDRGSHMVPGRLERTGAGKGRAYRGTGLQARARGAASPCRWNAADGLTRVRTAVRSRSTGSKPEFGLPRGGHVAGQGASPGGGRVVSGADMHVGPDGPHEASGSPLSRPDNGRSQDRP